MTQILLRTVVCKASLLLIFLSFGCTGPSDSKSQPSVSTTTPAAGITSSTQFVKATATETSIGAGGTAEATVQVSVQNGFHINANPPTFSYLKATELTAENDPPLVVGFIRYPNALTRKFAFADQPLSVYEGEVPIKLMLKADKSAAKRDYKLSAKLKVQACDEQVCYPPGTIDLTIPVTIK